MTVCPSGEPKGEGAGHEAARAARNRREQDRFRSRLDQIIDWGFLEGRFEHRMCRNHLAHTSGDAINAILGAVGHNFSLLLLTWLRLLLLRLLTALAGPDLLKAT